MSISHKECDAIKPCSRKHSPLPPTQGSKSHSPTKIMGITLTPRKLGYNLGCNHQDLTGAYPYLRVPLFVWHLTCYLNAPQLRCTPLSCRPSLLYPGCQSTSPSRTPSPKHSPTTNTHLAPGSRSPRRTAPHPPAVSYSGHQAGHTTTSSGSPPPSH